MNDKVEQGRAEIMTALLNLRSVHNKQPGSYSLQVWFNAKADEIIKVFSKELAVNKGPLVNVLKQIDPANTTKWESMLSQN